MNEIDKIVYQAKLAEQAERYDEMVRAAHADGLRRAASRLHRCRLLISQRWPGAARSPLARRPSATPSFPPPPPPPAADPPFGTPAVVPFARARR